MSGTQWSPERLRELADWCLCGEEPNDHPIRAAGHALRAFARVVGVLGDKRLQLRRVDPSWGYEVRIANHKGTGTDVLAAILALADALDAGRGDE